MNTVVSRLKSSASKIEWVNFLFITLSPIVAIVGTVWTLKVNGFYWETLLFTFFFLYASGVSISAGYHRLFSHRSYQANPIVKLFFLLFAGAAFEGSSEKWANDHRRHHRHVDHTPDPYNIQKGFWWAHVGWVIAKAPKPSDSGIPDLLRDPLVQFQSRFNVFLSILVGFIFPTLLAWSWGDPWGGFFIAGMARVVVNHHFTFFINSFCHIFGKQNYSDQDSSKDSWWLAYLTYGEGYHNYHHTFQWDYRNGIKAWHFDPAKWLIATLSWVGLAWDLKRVQEEKILAARLTMQEKQMRERVPAYVAAKEEWNEMVVATRQKVEEFHRRFLELKKEYADIRRARDEKSKALRVKIQNEMIEIRLHFKVAADEWRSLFIKSQIPQTA